MGLMGVMVKKHKIKNALAQQDSGNSKLNLGVLRILRSLGILGGKTVRQGVRMKTENRKTRMRPAQQDSEISILKNRPLCPCCPLCPLVFKNALPQWHSKMSNLDPGDIVTPKGIKELIFTMLIKNLKTVLWVDGGMSQ